MYFLAVVHLVRQTRAVMCWRVVWALVETVNAGEEPGIFASLDHLAPSGEENAHALAYTEPLRLASRVDVSDDSGTAELEAEFVLH